MRGLVQSGGGSRIDVLIASMLEVVKRGYDPQWLGGVSSGLLSCLSFEFGIAGDVLKLVMEDRLAWMKNKPMTNEGKMTASAIWKIVSGKNYLSDQVEYELIDKWIGGDRWDEYRRSGRPIYTTIVCVEDGEIQVHNLKKLPYEKAKLVISASCRVPFWTETVLIDGKHWADGGWRDHNPSLAIMRSMDSPPEMLISISTRPIVPQGYPKGLFGMLGKVIAVYGKEVTESDADAEMMYCKQNKIKRYFRRLRDCKNHPYDTDPIRSAKSVNMAIEDIADYDLIKHCQGGY